MDVTNSELKVIPSSSMLLLMDFQNGILANYPDVAPYLLATALDVLTLARESGIGVGFVRVAFEDSDYDAVPASNKTFSAFAAARRLPAAAPESKIASAIAPSEGEKIYRKIRVGALSTTDLEADLKAKNIDTLILAGIATGGVVLSTVRDAADKDYRIIVLKDACTDVDPQVHEVLVEKLFPRQATVTTVAEFIAAQQN
jgi:nicotinamidase-related amidase